MNFGITTARFFLFRLPFSDSTYKILTLIGLIFTTFATLALTPPESDHPGKSVYDKACATCHNAPSDARVPTLTTLSTMPAGQVSEAMNEGGKMAPMAASLSDSEKIQLTDYLSSGQTPIAANWGGQFLCSAENRIVDVDQIVVSNGFSIDRNQTRSLSAKQAGLTMLELKNLEIAWAIGIPNQGGGTGASIVGDTLFVNGGGQLVALDATSGCVRWGIAVKSRNTPVFGEIEGRKVVALANKSDVLVVDAATGEKIWQANAQPTDNPGSIRGGVVIYKDKIIVPISASGVGASRRPTFECCVGHGAVVALSVTDGSKLWEYHTMPKAQYNGKVSSLGVKQRGPSGAPIWSYPVIDEKRNRVIVTTGENTSHPATLTADAIIALDLNTGKEVWKFQGMELDVWNMACISGKRGSGESDLGPNCPWNMKGDPRTGRDFDFGAGAIIATGKDGKDVVLAGQKSGDTWALNADTGKLVWNVRFGEGTPLGGIHWGISTDGKRLFAAINDPIVEGEQNLHPGIYAVDIKTGKPVWGYDAKPNCDGERATLVSNCETRFGFSAAPLTVDGAVIAGTLGGEVMIFNGETGELLNRIDTIGPVDTINNVEAKGGSIDSHGISAGAGMIFINSGYGAFGQTAGNALIAYKPKDK